MATASTARRARAVRATTPPLATVPAPSAAAVIPQPRAYRDQPCWCTRCGCEHPRWQRDECDRRAANAYSDAYWAYVQAWR